MDLEKCELEKEKWGSTRYMPTVVNYIRSPLLGVCILRTTTY